MNTSDPVDLLAAHLRKHGKSQRGLAMQAGIAEAHVSRYLNRQRRPGLDIAVRLELATHGEVPAFAWAHEGRKK